MEKEIHENKRSSIKNLAYTFLHWLFVVFLSAISFVVQYSFLIDTGETHSSIIFSGSIYHVNYLMFPIGVALFLVGYYILWKKYLVEDWKGFKQRFWLWKVAYVIIALVALAAIFVAGILGLFLNLGLSGDIQPEWTTWGFAAFPIYVVLVVVIDLWVSRKK